MSSPAPHPYIEKILRARIYDLARETPLEQARTLSRRLGHSIWIKREDLQVIHSFKIRGAYNKISQLPQSALARGVIAASAGNHAQGVALAARHCGTQATIVMPRTTPEIKVRAVEDLGAVIELHGDDFASAQKHAKERCEQEGLHWIPPYDDAEIIAGQGTVAMELLRQHPEQIDAIFVPVGGGGLIAGIAAYTKYLSPSTRIIGVEPEDAACLAAACKAGQPVTLERVGMFADGCAVARVGDEPFAIAREKVDEVITVTTDEICAAIKDVFIENRSMAEAAGALSVAGLKNWVRSQGEKDLNLIAIETGANLTFGRLRHVTERAEYGESREALLAVTIPEKKGSFLDFCQALGPVRVTEFNYRYAGSEQAHIFVGIGLEGADGERESLLKRLRKENLPVTDLTDDEMAKLHIRYMVGGHAPESLEHERLFRFEFPERPGALLDFLTSIGARWNISLFHYRNHDAAFGRVLVGMQIRDEDLASFHELANELGYPVVAEEDNPAYDRFLR